VAERQPHSNKRDEIRSAWPPNVPPRTQRGTPHLRRYRDDRSSGRQPLPSWASRRTPTCCGMLVATSSISMGGLMARPVLGGRATCESCPSIDVREWHRQGRLQSGQQFSWSWTCGGESAGSVSVRVESAAVVLSYRSCSSGSSEWKAIEQRLPISLTNTSVDPYVLIRGAARPVDHDRVPS
jgi:hypothetical protein